MFEVQGHQVENAMYWNSIAFDRKEDHLVMSI